MKNNHNKSRTFTGNRFVAIPDILKTCCGILDISFVYMRYRAVIELKGTEEEPFLSPVIRVGGKPLDFSKAEWDHKYHWLPVFELKQEGVKVKGRIFAPLTHRGFVWVIEIESESGSPLEIEAGWKGRWVETSHIISTSKPMKGERICSISRLHGWLPFIEFRGEAPIFAVAFCPSEEMSVAISSDCEAGRIITRAEDGEAVAGHTGRICYDITKQFTLSPGERKTVSLYVGLGLEEVSAISSAIDLKRQGWSSLENELTQWLDAHSLKVEDQTLNRVLNTNSFYNFFYSEAFTMDTEELVLLTARSSSYNVSAAYWDRDAMLWSFPSILQIEPLQARRMIEYALTRQLQNVGVHSRFIDGVIFEPGFALDQLCAPIRALSMYVRATRDISILFDRRVQAGVNRIRRLLSSRKHPTITLFNTMLLPSDMEAKYPYVAYDNVLVWRALSDLEWIYELIHDLDRSEENKQLAKNVQKAIMDNFIVDGPFGPMFAWSIDLQGNYDIKDEPSGSLQLLSWLEFCPPDFPAYQNTVKWIHSKENPYSFCDAAFPAAGSEYDRHPSVLSVANDLLTDRVVPALDFLRRAKLDDGIACAAVDESTGEMVSGPAFASGAGYLAFALGYALGAKVFGPEPEPTDKLYEPPPAEIRDSI